MKIPNFLPRKKLRAATARRSPGAPPGMDYEEMSEPNMKLSRALLIVLVLHVVAVAGIIAFNSIKTRQGPLPPARSSASSANNSKTADGQTAKAALSTPVPLSATPLATRDEAKAAHAVTRIQAKDERKAERAKAADSGKTYVVAKGENPVSIAKKLKVSYDALLAINHIDDPHKLQIGQKLLIPARTPKPAKKTDE